MNDLTIQVKDPAKTILIGHVPPRLSGKRAPDRAFFGEIQEKRKDPSKEGRLSIVPGFYQALINEVLQEDAIPLRWENRGYTGLAKVIAKIWPDRTEKMVHGNFEESAHRASTRTGIKIPQGTYVDHLYWNGSCLDLDRIGLLHVRPTRKGIEVAYKNICLPIYS